MGQFCKIMFHMYFFEKKWLYVIMPTRTLSTRRCGHDICIQRLVGKALPTPSCGHELCPHRLVGKVLAHKAFRARSLPTRRCRQGSCPQDVVGKYCAHTVLWASSMPWRPCRHLKKWQKIFFFFVKFYFFNFIIPKIKFYSFKQDFSHRDLLNLFQMS